ncbi:site-2 protease family protein [Haloferula sp.]|uniref:site-2 protease family protein n=1 Tax=Haloferula sp. TaxID=2497595 RepID=UPI003C777F54
MVRFSLFGIPIEIQPWFWISLILIGALSVSEGATSDGLIVLSLFVLAGFISILVHELGHALVGRSFGAPTAITLQAFGGYAAFPPGSFNRKQNFLMTAAGPFFQIVLGLIALAISMFAPLPATLISVFVTFIIWISFFWAILNLIPVLPLDGGRLMETVLGPKRIKLTLTISMIVAIGAAILMFTRTGSFIFPIFLGMMAYQNWQALQQHR